MKELWINSHKNGILIPLDLSGVFEKKHKTTPLFLTTICG
jgi:hypothetical protein